LKCGRAVPPHPGQYNPELLDKKRLLAVSKSDMLDDELREAVQAELPTEIPSVFISSVTQQGLLELKDLIWKTLHDKTQ
jgi:GTP-binding protein